MSYRHTMPGAVQIPFTHDAQIGWVHMGLYTINSMETRFRVVTPTPSIA